MKAHLYDAADDLWEHVEWESQDVEQRQGHKGPLCIQDIIFIHSHIYSKRRQGHLKHIMRTNTYLLALQISTMVI